MELRARGMPLGLMPGMAYEEKEHVLQPGDSVLLHSDGVVESHDPDRSDMFGFPRLKEAVGKFAPGGELIDRVLAELASFTGAGAEQEDDITMVTLERSAGGAHVAATSNGRVLAEFTLPSEPGNEREAMERVERAVENVGIEAARMDRLKTAVAEATMNAMEHGNEYRADRPVVDSRAPLARRACACRSAIAAKRSRCPSARSRTSRPSSRAVRSPAAGACS